MIRWRSAVLGAVVFVTAHLVLMARWREWFQPGGDFPAWFLNSSRAMAWTGALLFIAGALVGFARGGSRDAIVAGGNLAGGATVAMCVVLALTGPGTLFPIALTIGAAVIVFNCVAGALTAWAVGGG
jgi:uncharacterized membrane protein (UPF0136 family)